MKTETTMKEVKSRFAAAGVHPDTLGKDRDGNFTARWEFFYRQGRTSEGFAEAVRKAIPEATIIEHREVWKPFRGGATTANSSHFLVKFRYSSHFTVTFATDLHHGPSCCVSTADPTGAVHTAASAEADIAIARKEAK